MKPPYERGNDVTVFSVIIIARSKYVGWHHGYEIGPVLTAIRLTQLNARDLRDRVPLIGWLERAGKQFVFLHGLLR